jgi:hypothetical protein
MLRRILTYTGYLLSTIVLVGGTFGLVAYGNDYTYDLHTHKLVQNGHVIINSVPGNIALVADGKQLKKKTPYQAAYKVGLHTFGLVRDGYWPWQKTLKVIAGQVSLVRYVVLVPRAPKTVALDTRPQVMAQSISKDHRHLAYITGGADPAVYTMDLGNPKAVKLYSPPAATETVPAETLSGVSWSDDASHLMIVSTAAGAPVHRLAAASGGEPVNLTAQYHYNFSGIKFSDSNWRQLYWLAPDGLRRLDVDAQTVSAVLADKVTQFWVEPDRVLYVQQTELGRSLWSLDGRGRHQRLIQALAESDSYSVAYVNYRGEDELAVVPAKTQTGTLYTGIYGDTPVAKTVAQGVVEASFSPDGHLLVMSSPTRIVTCDLEQSLLYGRLVTYAVADQPGNLLALTWFDNYHLLANRDSKLYWSEFDGANQVELGSAAGNFPAYSTADIKSLLTFRPDGQQVRLEQVQIKQ